MTAPIARPFTLAFAFAPPLALVLPREVEDLLVGEAKPSQDHLQRHFEQARLRRSKAIVPVALRVLEGEA